MRPGRPSESTVVYPGGMSVDLFEDVPGSCAYGHDFRPGLVTRGWMPCGCRAARENHDGHLYIVCHQCEQEGRREFLFLPACTDDCE
jgi:hypothetical protein